MDEDFTTYKNKIPVYENKNLLKDYIFINRHCQLLQLKDINIFYLFQPLKLIRFC